jgi:electron transport complex protein RnfG
MKSTELTNALSLAAFLLAAIVGVTLMYKLTQPQIAITSNATLNLAIQDVLATSSYNNNPAQDTKTVQAEALGTAVEQTVYRARLQDEPVAVVITAVAPDGYSGDINLLIGISYDGTLTGVRVTHHRETPGLGDDIEHRRSDWIYAFDALQPGTMAANEWQVKKRGGKFDQFTGATITPTAVIQAVKRVSDWYLDNRDLLFDNE